jgi:hypothetical protein
MSTQSNDVYLAISEIARDMLLQPRATLHQDWIEEYAAEMAGDAKFPPIVVFFDGVRHWLADGFHRTHAAVAAGLSTILASVRLGTRRDALLYSLAANADHGYRRTTDDKRRAIDIMLADPVWVLWSNSEVARRCGVDHKTVAARRTALAPIIGNSQDSSRLVTRGGSTYEMNTAGIGPGVDDDSPAPDAPPAPRALDTPLDVFDWEAGWLRDRAMEAIRAMAKLPSPDDVLAAWMKSYSYGEPQATFDAAIQWLDGCIVNMNRSAGHGCCGQRRLSMSLNDITERARS